MHWASSLLAALSIILAWPIPRLLAHAAWPARAPATALVLWQAIALAGGLSMIGALLTWGVEPLGDNLVDGVAGLVALVLGTDAGPGLSAVHVFAVSAALLLGTHLVLTLVVTYERIHRRRRRHLGRLSLVGSRSRAVAVGAEGAVPARSVATVVINHPTPVAYCIPGAGSVTVLSRGLLEMLTQRELDAVVAHERAHLTQRHDLLVMAFAAWRTALPWLPTSQLSLSAVSELTEMLADDGAVRSTDRETVIRALAQVAAGGGMTESPVLLSPTVIPDAGRPITGDRIRRLLQPETPVRPILRAAGVLASGVLLAVPTVLLLSPAMIA